MYKYNLDPCGPTHILIGDGGNIEGTQTQTIDQAYSTTGRLPEAPQHGAPLLRHLPGARAPRLALAVPDAELAAHTWPHRWLCLALWILCL